MLGWNRIIKPCPRCGAAPRKIEFRNSGPIIRIGCTECRYNIGEDVDSGRIGIDALIDYWNEQEVPYDLSPYKTGDWVLFWVRKNEGHELHEGTIEIIDKNGGGINMSICPSFDILCKDTMFKHISIYDIEKRMTIGFAGDSCVFPPLWGKLPQEIEERKGGGDDNN